MIQSNYKLSIYKSCGQIPIAASVLNRSLIIIEMHHQKPIKPQISEIIRHISVST